MNLFEINAKEVDGIHKGKNTFWIIKSGSKTKRQIGDNIHTTTKKKKSPEIREKHK